jgi:large subunit ribosomal protein L25
MCPAFLRRTAAARKAGFRECSVADLVLSVERREKTGKGGARATRRDDKIPGVLYGGPRGAVPIELKRNELIKALRSGKFISHLIEIDHRGERQPVIPRAIQYHPVTDAPLHVDLFRVEESSRIAVDVPVHFINHEASPGLKRGGVLNIVRHTVELECPAGQIPEELVIDLAGVDIGAVIHISAVALPEGVTPVIKDRDFTVATLAGRGGPSGGAASDEAAEG